MTKCKLFQSDHRYSLLYKIVRPQYENHYVVIKGSLQQGFSVMECNTAECILASLQIGDPILTTLHAGGVSGVSSLDGTHCRCPLYR